MADITQVISTIPDAGHRGVDARTAFVTKQEAFQDAITDAFVSQINTFGTQANSLKVDVNNLKADTQGIKDATQVIRNETDNIRILANTQTQAQVTLATTQAGIATTKANEASVSASQALTSKNAIQSYVIPSGASYSVDSINTQNSAMTKAQFNALAEERKANRAGSGFDEFGKHENQGIINTGMYTQSSISTQSANIVYYGRMDSSGIGTSKTGYPIINMNGNNIILKGTDVSGYNVPATLSSFKLPTAPNIYPYDTVLTAEQIASGVIKHADASNSGLIVNGKFDVDTSGWTQTTGVWSSTSNGATTTLSASEARLDQTILNLVAGKKYIVEFDYTSRIGSQDAVSIRDATTSIASRTLTALGRYTLEFTATLTAHTVRTYANGTGTFSIDNIAVYPADAISRSDLAFLESWHEDISEKNFVYPLGNVQYLGANTDGLTGIANGAFTGFETYSLFGNWQTPSALIGKGYVWSSLTEAQKKAFITNSENNCYLDGDKVIQVRYRVRVVQGLGDSWGNVDTQLNGSYTNLNYAPSFSVSPKGKLVNTNDYANNDSYRYWGAVGVLDTLVVSNNKNTGAFTSRDSSIGTFSYEKNAYAIPIALVHR